MKYLIFTIELVAILLWLLFSPNNWGIKIIGFIVIIGISQVLHTILKAR